MSNASDRRAAEAVPPGPGAGDRAQAIAGRLVEGAGALATLADGLSEAEWQTRLPEDGRKVGVIVHHVACLYPVGIALALAAAHGRPLVGLVSADIDTMNAAHAIDHDGATRAQTLHLLRRNSADAAAAIEALTDEQLDRAVPVSLYSDAPLTCQFILEDHAVRHSYHHLARIRAALGR